MGMSSLGPSFQWGSGEVMDAAYLLAVDAKTARANHARVNAILAKLAARYGRLVDLHAHFLRGDDTWFVNTIEPSLVGASEVRRAFLAAL